MAGLAFPSRPSSCRSSSQRATPRSSAKSERHDRSRTPGFYPAVGGKIRVSITPAKQLGRIEIEERGENTARRVRAVVAKFPYAIAEREVRDIAITVKAVSNGITHVSI